MQNYFFDKKKNRKFENIWLSLHFCGMIIFIKTKPLCRVNGMTDIPKFPVTLTNQPRKLEK